MITVTKDTNTRGKEPTYYVQIQDNLPFSYTLTGKQLEELYLEIVPHLFDNILEQNKDILVRLKNNIPAPKKLDADKVIEWLDKLTHNLTVVEQFKKNFGL